MSPLEWCCLLAATSVTAPPGEELLAKIADVGNRPTKITYSGRREYRVRNARFAQHATVFVQMTYRAGEGKRFNVLQRDGSDRLTAIIEKVLATESDASTPVKRAEVEISAANYQARVRGTASMGGHDCYVVDLIPKRKSKLLIRGTVWVDRQTYGVVRIEGSPTESLSLWIGKPDIVAEFAEVGGHWLPSYVKSVSSGFLLGTSEMEIRYSDYRVPDVQAEPTAQSVGSGSGDLRSR